MSVAATTAAAPNKASVMLDMRKTRGALLGGLRNGKLEAAVAKMEADTAHDDSATASAAPASAPPAGLSIDVSSTDAEPCLFSPGFVVAKEAKMRQVQIESTRRMFNSVDTDLSGYIDPNEFQRLMRKQ